MLLTSLTPLAQACPLYASDNPVTRAAITATAMALLLALWLAVTLAVPRLVARRRHVWRARAARLYGALALVALALDLGGAAWMWARGRSWVPACAGPSDAVHGAQLQAADLATLLAFLSTLATLGIAIVGGLLMAALALRRIAERSGTAR